MSVQLYDTLSRQLRTLVPLTPDGPFRMYCCGPTVYGPAHIGNFRTFVNQDILRRVLQLDGLDVRHVRNITDVDDKTIRRSQDEGLSLAEFCGKWTQRFHADCAALNILPPHVEPSAVEHIPLQVAMIAKLIARGHAYATPDGSVYFKVAACPGYGKLSHFDLAGLRTQATTSSGEDLNNADEYEREHVADFALWKARKPEDGDNHWPSPWGEGRPGWHIECSAMSTHYLGNTFELHGGGEDLCFPHHENEIAQAECATGEKDFAAHWFHGKHLMVDGEKMSKSKNNLYTIDDLRALGHSPMTVRYALLAGHYRSQLNFTHKGLDDAAAALAKIEKGARRLVAKSKLFFTDFVPITHPEPDTSWGRFSPAWEALRNDLNVPAALGKFFSAMTFINNSDTTVTQARVDLSGFGNFLYALGIILPQETPAAAAPPPPSIPPEVAALAEQRWAAKQARDYAKADVLRKELESLGWKSTDRKDSYSLEKLS